MEEACGSQQAKTVGNVSLLEGTRGKCGTEQAGGKMWMIRNSHGRLSTSGPGRASSQQSTDSFGKFLGHHRLYSAIAGHHELHKGQRGRKIKGAPSP